MAGPNALDLYEQQRADIHNTENSADYILGKIDAAMGTKQEAPTPITSEAEKQLQGSQKDTASTGITLEAKSLKADDISNERSQEAKDQDKKDSMGILKVLDWATSPLQALGDAAAAPIADQQYPGTGAVDDTLHALKVSGQALVKRLLPDIKETAPDYGREIVDQQMPNLPEWSKPVVATGISLITDPTVTLGIGGAKIFQAGMEAKALQSEGKATVSNRGIWEEGVSNLLGLTRVKDETKLTEVGQLAAKADRGDKEAFKALQDRLSDKNTTALMNAVDQQQKANKIKVFQEAFGDSNAPIVVFDKAKATSADLKAQRMNIADNVGNVIDKVTPPTGPQFASSINLSKLNTSEDVDVFLSEIAKQHPDLMEAARTAPKTKAAILEATAQENAQLADLVGRKTGTFTREQAMTLRAALNMTAPLAQKYMEKAYQTKSALDMALAKKAYLLNLMVQQKVTGVVTERSRALSDLKIQPGTSREMFEQIQKILKNDDFDKHYMEMMREFSAEGLDPSQFLKLMDKGELTLAAAAKDKSWKAYDMFYEAYVNAVLSGPITHMINMTSNSAMLAIRPSEAYLKSLSAAARMDWAHASSEMKQANAMVAGLAGGIADGFRLATGRASKSQINYPEELLKLHELSRQRVKPMITSANLGATGMWGRIVDALGTVIRLPGEMLLKEDKGFKYINYRMAINQEAAKRASFMSSSAEDAAKIYQVYRNNPDQTITKTAIDLADLYTFTNKLEGKWLTLEEGFRTPIVNLVMPFFRTPVNIVKFGVRNSFVGNAFKDIATGDFARMTPKGDAARAKIAIGTAIPLSILALAGDRITGGYDMATEEGRFRAEFEGPPYSVRVGDKWVSYERLEPLKSILGMMCNYRDAGNALLHPKMGADEQDLMTEIAATTLSPFIQTVGDNSFFEFFGQVHWMLEGARSSDMGVFQRWFTKIGAAVVMPNAFSQSNTMAFDNTYRMADTFLEQVKKRSPIFGASKELPYRPNAFGDPQFVPRGVPFSMVNPFLTRPDKHDKVADKMSELEVNIPDMTPRELTFNGVKLELNTQQRHNFGVIVGRGIKENADKGWKDMPPIHDILSDSLKDPKFIELPPNIQKKRIEGLYTLRREAAVNFMVRNDPELNSRYLEVLNQQKLSGVRK